MTWLEGAMQDFPLTLAHVRRRMATVHHAREVVTIRDETGTQTRASFAQVADRAARLAGALRDLGIGPGDRVGSFVWNTQEHLEVYYAVPCMGAVLHTMNLRLSPEQVAFTANHAGARVIVLDDSLVAAMEHASQLLETVEHFVVIGDGSSDGLRDVLRYEELLAAQETPFRWPEVPERAAAALCYTSGTTGDPKGVLYSHRALTLHALIAAAGDSLRVSERHRVLATVPMFHAMGWNLPYACGLTGADLVMPGRFLQSHHLARMIQGERITYTAGVPTIFTDLLRYADEHGSDLSSLEVAMCGGTQVPRSLMQAFEDRHGVAVTQGWGMTETLPGATVAHDPPAADAAARWHLRALAGRPSPLYELRVMADDGAEQPWDGRSTGEIEIRGPVVARGYFRRPDASADRFDDGWLRTGDVGAMDADGWLRITDRAKDVIKSGGEWISSAELESALMACPGVLEAAVIGKPDERWSERPLACVVVRGDVPPAELRSFLSQRVARWWVPDEFAYLDEIPKTSVGKLDKKVLRERLLRGELGVVRSASGGRRAR